MKRFFFSLIALSAAAIGCTQSALLESPVTFNQEVSFSPYTGRTPVTKATAVVEEAGLASTEGFNVYGFLKKEGETTPSLYMNNVNVYSPSKEGEDWTYDKLVYWPDVSSKSTLSFVAYSSNAINKGLDATQTGFTYTVDRSVDNHVDLLATAYQEGLRLDSGEDKVANGQVQLTFYHLLSRVGFQLYLNKNESAARSVKIENITFTGIMPNEGSLTFTDYKGTATPKLKVESEDKSQINYTDFIKTPFETATSTSAAVQTPIFRGVTQTVNGTTSVNINDKYMMIMPHTIADGDNHEISVTYKVGTVSTNGTNNTVSYPTTSKTVKASLPTGFKFEAGKAYEFILKISTSAIKFEVDIEESDWNNPEYVHTEDGLIAVAEVKNSNSADIILTPRESESVLGVIGVQWREKPATQTEWGDDNKVNVSSGYSANQSYPISLTGLDPNTEYEYRPYSIVDGVTKYYTEGTFKTKALDMSLSLENGAMVIYSDRVTVEATLRLENATITEKGFCIVQGNTKPTTANRKIAISTGNFKTTFDGLSPATEYSCCAYVIIGGETFYSTKVTFLTAPEITATNPDQGPFTFTVNATPNTATIELEATGYSKVTAIGTASITVASGTEVTYTVSSEGYVTVTGTRVIDHTHPLEVTLTKQDSGGSGDEENGEGEKPGGKPADSWEDGGSYDV